MIFREKYLVKNPVANIIIVHGIAEHSGRYKNTALMLNSHNYNVYTYDLLGHGKSSGKKGRIKSYKDHLDTLHKYVLEVKEESNLKVFLLGHSMGGGLVNIYGVNYQDVDGIISIAAATMTPSNAKVLKYIGFWYLRWIKLSTKMFDKHLAKDPNVLALNKKDPLMLKHFYISLIGEMFIKGVKDIKTNIGKFNTPVLYLHGTSDKIVDYKASQYMFNNIQVEDKKIILYEDEYHEILNDYNKELVYKDIIEWLNKHI